MDIYDIAKKSGYSIATVSRVLNNSDKVSQKAKDKIQKVIEENNYSPNRVARSLATNESSLVGIMVPDIRNYFESQSAYELEKNLRAHGYLTLLGDSSNNLDGKIKYFNLLVANNVDAIVCVGSTYEQEDFYEYLLNMNNGIPIAMLNSNPLKKLNNISYVYIDEVDALNQALIHLKSKGYEHPIFVSYKKDVVTRSYIAKKAGFIESMLEIFPKIDFTEFKISEIQHDLPKLYNFLKNNKKFDSICFELDSIAIPSFKYLVSKGINIPGDIGIIGFDNIDATNYSSKKITSIDQNIKIQAKIATKSLVKLINKEDLDINNNMIKAKLVVKETT